VSTVTVQLFASYAESFGGPTLNVPFATHDQLVDARDEIALIPPVAGG